MQSGPAGSQASPIAAEAAAWRERGRAVRRWEVSRARCAFWAVAGPLMLAAITAIVVVMAAEREGYGTDWALPSTLIAAVIGLALSLEFVVLALRGGGLEATERGLEYHLVLANGFLPWTDIGDAQDTRQFNVRGRTYPVLAIHLNRRGRSWPLSIVLWGSKPDCLCITTYVFPGNAEAIANGIEAARAAQCEPDPGS